MSDADDISALTGLTREELVATFDLIYTAYFGDSLPTEDVANAIIEAFYLGARSAAEFAGAPIQ